MVLSSRDEAYRALADAEARGLLSPERLSELREELTVADARAVAAGVPTKPVAELSMEEFAAYRTAIAGRR
jgi:hypothetical protein